MSGWFVVLKSMRTLTRIQPNHQNSKNLSESSVPHHLPRNHLICLFNVIKCFISQSVYFKSQVLKKNFLKIFLNKKRCSDLGFCILVRKHVFLAKIILAICSLSFEVPNFFGKSLENAFTENAFNFRQMNILILHNDSKILIFQFFFLQLT